MMIPSFEVTWCIAFSFSITARFVDLVADRASRRSFLVDEMDRAGLEGNHVHQSQRDFRRRLLEERHSVPQDHRMNRQIVLVNEPSLGKGLGKLCATSYVDVAAGFALQSRNLFSHIGDRQLGMVP